MSQTMSLKSRMMHTVDQLSMAPGSQKKNPTKADDPGLVLIFVLPQMGGLCNFNHHGASACHTYWMILTDP